MDAVTSAVCVVVTELVVTVNVPVVEPLGTVVVAGTCTAELLELSVTATPEDPAPAEIVTVPVLLLPPRTEFGLMETETTPKGLTLIPPTWTCPLELPVMRTLCWLVTTRVVIVKLADVAPAGTVTEAGTVAAAGTELVRDTTSPPGGAAPLSVTPPVTTVVDPPTL